MQAARRLAGKLEHAWTGADEYFSPNDDESVAVLCVGNEERDVPGLPCLQLSQVLLVSPSLCNSQGKGDHHPSCSSVPISSCPFVSCF